MEITANKLIGSDRIGFKCYEWSRNALPKVDVQASMFDISFQPCFFHVSVRFGDTNSASIWISQFAAWPMSCVALRLINKCAKKCLCRPLGHKTLITNAAKSKIESSLGPKTATNPSSNYNSNNFLTFWLCSCVQCNFDFVYNIKLPLLPLLRLLLPLHLVSNRSAF